MPKYSRTLSIKSRKKHSNIRAARRRKWAETSGTTSDIQTEQINYLRHENEDLTLEVEASEQQINQLSVDLETKEREISGLKTKIIAMEGIIRLEEKEKDRLQEAFEVMEGEKERLERQLGMANEERTSLARTIQGLRANNTRLKSLRARTT